MSVDFKEYTRKMEKTLDVLQDNFGAVRAGRANAKVLDRLPWNTMEWTPPWPRWAPSPP